MKSMGLHVERPIVPTSLELSNDEKLLQDPNAYAVRVRDFNPLVRFAGLKIPPGGVEAP
jgi:hypothetical protein